MTYARMAVFPILFSSLLVVGPWAAAAGHPAAAGPLAGIHAYVCGLHFYSGQMARQVVAHHYCAHGTGELMQCVIYDSNRKDARLIGIEYVIGAGQFRTLTAEEKKLWHSHAYEVKAGLLVAPGLPRAAELELMKKFATTYGKTWQTWQVDRDAQVPMGIPQLLMGFTADGQVDPKLVAGRDRALGIATAAKKAARADLAAGPVEPGADAWRQGEAAQLELGWVRGPVPFSGK